MKSQPSVTRERRLAALGALFVVALVSGCGQALPTGPVVNPSSLEAPAAATVLHTPYEDGLAGGGGGGGDAAATDPGAALTTDPSPAPIEPLEGPEPDGGGNPNGRSHGRGHGHGNGHGNGRGRH